MNPRVILFDIYKTLLDITTDETDPAAYRMLARWMQQAGGNLLSAAELRARYLALTAAELAKSPSPYPDIEIRTVFEQLIGENCPLPTRHISGYAATFGILFRILTTRKLGIYPAVIPNLQALQPHFRLAIISNAQRLFTTRELQKFGLPPFFEHITFSSDLGISKPDPNIFLHSCRALGIAPSEAVYVGDSLRDDVEGAQRVGIPTIWIDHGAGTDSHQARTNLPKPTARLTPSSYASLPNLFL